MPTLTLRKVIRFGRDGLVVTVPKGWARYYGLKAGDRLEVVANGELTMRVVKADSPQAQSRRGDEERTHG